MAEVKYISNFELQSEGGMYTRFSVTDSVRIGKDPTVWVIKSIKYTGGQSKSFVRFMRTATPEEHRKTNEVVFNLEINFAHVYEYGLKHVNEQELEDCDPNVVFMRSKLYNEI